jgi:serine/threonine protein phosphatase PrpC
MPFGRIKAVPGIDCAWYGRTFVGERLCGDAALALYDGGKLFLAMIDGMGHGPEANSVAVKACEHLKYKWTADLTSTMAELDVALRETLGGSVGMCTLDIGSGMINYAAVGNVMMRLEGTACQKYHAKEGVVGGHRASPRHHSARLGNGDILILHTDGVSERFRIQDVPQLRSLAAGNMARAIVDEFGKSYDDVTCLVLKRSK